MAKLESATLKLSIDANYIVVEDGDLIQFQKDVNVYLASGYLPIGGVSISTCLEENSNIHIWYAQAMILMNAGLTVSAEVPE